MVPVTKRDPTPISATPVTRQCCCYPKFLLGIISITALVIYSYVSDRFVVAPDSAVSVVRTTTFHTSNDAALQPLMIVTEHDNATTSTHYFDTPNETILLQNSNSTSSLMIVTENDNATKSKRYFDTPNETVPLHNSKSTSSVTILTEQHDNATTSTHYFDTPNETVPLNNSNSTSSLMIVTENDNATKSIHYFNTPNETIPLNNSNPTSSLMIVTEHHNATTSIHYFDNPNETVPLNNSTSTSSATSAHYFDIPNETIALQDSTSTVNSTTLFIATTSNISSSFLSASSLSRMIDIQRERPSYKKNCYFEYDALPIGLGITYDVSVGYHVGMLNNWRSIMLDQFHTMEICGLGYMTSDLTISFSNPSPNTTEDETVEMLKEVLYQFPFMNKSGHNNDTMNVTFINASQAFPYERPIMEHIGMVCRRHHNAAGQSESKQKSKTKIVFYFHSKGTSKYVEENITKMTDEKYRERYTLYENIFYWRKYMEWFLLEKPTLCIRALLFDRKSKACGVNLNPSPIHYTGNFWTSTCRHIKDLRIRRQWPLNGPPNGRHRNFQYISAELWLGNYTSVSFQGAYPFVSLFLMHTSLYYYSASPEKYEWIISKQEFLRINSSSFLTKGKKDYYFPNQTDLWLDYLSGIKGLTIQGND